jgi:NADPH:quinone reductase-like Zn-dependent oxidoreductase
LKTAHGRYLPYSALAIVAFTPFLVLVGNLEMRGNHTLPQTISPTMRVLELRAYDGKLQSLSLVEKPVPRPDKGQVLVRMAAAPINPSDLMFLRGFYAMKKNLPVVPGFEGSGTVVAAGSGLKPRLLLGRRVACAAPFDGDGTWAEYMVTSANFCVPLRKSVNLEEGATLIVNPLTAWALLGMAMRGRHRAVVQNAAASALGRMILRLSNRLKIPVIHIVRRKEQAELLRSLGAKYFLDSSAQDFDERLRELCHQLHATLAFDAVAGEMTGRLLRAMPRGARLVVYGALSEQACQIDPRSFIFEGKFVEGFWLAEWLRGKNVISQMRTAIGVQKFLANDLKTEVRERFPLEEAVKGLAYYASKMTEGKILLVPNSQA